MVNTSMNFNQFSPSVKLDC